MRLGAIVFGVVVLLTALFVLSWGLASAVGTP